MLIHWIWLSTLPGMNDRQKLEMLNKFRDPEDLYYGDPAIYRKTEGMTEEVVAALSDKDLCQAEKILDQCIEKDIHICTYFDAAYPVKLKNIADPPLILYYKGSLLEVDHRPVIAVVGTRKASAYGMNTAARMGYQIAKCGGIVVSGLAAGIDGTAMKGALTAGGNVIGVLGCGADIVYPASNRGLYADTEKNGCLISEFPPGTPPSKWNFPKRNRIISGLSNGVLVVEAPVKSGALITARQAADQGRDLFVVPGNIDVPTSKGSNALLRDGAMAVGSGWDILSEYQWLYPDKIQKDDRPVHLQICGEAQEENVPTKRKIMPQVAQKPLTPRKMSDKSPEKVNKTVDNGEEAPYSDGSKRYSALTEQEQLLLKPLLHGACLVDELMAQSNLPAGKVLSMLTLLEIKGIVVRLPGNRISFKN